MADWERFHDAALRSARARHDDLAVTTDSTANDEPNKEKSRQKIDGMVALISALSRVIAGAGMGSVYNARAKLGGEASNIRSM